MMEALRRGAGGWVAKLLLSILVVSFAIWGVADVFRGYSLGSLAKVGRTEISADDFQSAYQREMNSLSNQLGRRLTPEQARAFGLDSRVLSRLVGSAAIDAHARQLGLATSDTAVAEAIRTDPSFKGANGSFDRNLFRELLSQNNISEGRYFAERKSADLREQLTDTLLDAVTPPPLLLDILYRYREETRTISFITLDPAKVAKVPAPGESQLRDYYEQNKGMFVSPEFRKLDVLLLSTEEVKKLVPVSDDDVKAVYERDKEKFNDPEKRHVQQLSFPDMAAADKAYADLSKAKSFDEGATALGFKASDYDLGLVSRSDLIDKAIADTAFSLEKDKLSKPIAGKFTTVILRVTEIVPGKQRTFDDVKAKIRDQLATQAASHELQSLRDKVDDQRAAGKSLQEIADNLKLRFATVGPTDRGGKTPDGKPAFEHADAAKIVASGFEGDMASDREPVELEDGGYAWVNVTDITPEKQKPFEDVQAEVKSKWTEAETKKSVGAAAQAIVDKLNTGEKLDAIAKEQGTKVETSKPFKRNAPIPALTQAGVRQVFALADGKAASVETPDSKSRSVVVLTEINKAPPPSKEQMEQFGSEIGRQMQGDVIAEYVTAMQNRLGVSVNEALLKRTLGIDQPQ